MLFALEVEGNKKGAIARLSLFFNCRRCGFVSHERLVHGRTGLSVVRAGGSLEQMTTSLKAKKLRNLAGYDSRCPTSYAKVQI
jgi:hypothetical protein